jgi:phosphate transport system substrate-binding protein
LLAVDAGDGCIQPSPATVRDGSYKPLSRPLFIYVRLDSLARPDVAKFVEFYLANAGAVATEVGYVAVSDEVAAANKETLKAALASQEKDEGQ